MSSTNTLSGLGGASATSKFSNDEYTVGWVRALPLEMAAVKGMFNEEHGYPQTAPQQADQNFYILGRIS